MTPLVYSTSAACVQGPLGAGSGCSSGGGPESNCSYCPGDCVESAAQNAVYDWGACVGQGTCSRTVMQAHMPVCSGRHSFSDYLQVDYQCISSQSDTATARRARIQI